MPNMSTRRIQESEIMRSSEQQAKSTRQTSCVQRPPLLMGVTFFFNYAKHCHFKPKCISSKRCRWEEWECTKNKKVKRERSQQNVSNVCACALPANKQTTECSTTPVVCSWRHTVKNLDGGALILVKGGDFSLLAPVSSANNYASHTWATRGNQTLHPLFAKREGS